MQKKLVKKSGKMKKMMNKLETNGPECLWRDEEHEPEGDPEEWNDRVAGEVEEERLQKMQVLEKPEGSAKGISYLTARNVYDGRKKPYQLEMAFQSGGGREDQD